MNKFWKNIINPIFENIKPKNIVEVGSGKDSTTKNILAYCKKNNANLIIVDPFPMFNVEEFKVRYGERFEIQMDLSLNILPLLHDYDVIFLNGDPNWYTVSNELKIIEKKFENKKFPIVFLHNIGWPYAKRDHYYNPENIPPTYRQPYEKLGISEHFHLNENGGFNPDIYHSIHEKTPKNGVLTAIEDFISESSIEFSFLSINGFNGLGILFPKNKELENIVKDVIYNSDITNLLEEERRELYITLQKLVNDHLTSIKSLETKLNKNIDEKENLRDKIIHKSNELNNLQIVLDEKNVELDRLKSTSKKLESQLDSYIKLESKEKFYIKKLEEKKDDFKKLDLEVKSLSNNILEMEYSNNYRRSIINRLISTFPSLYILFKMGKSNIKNSILTVKGYKLIKKNGLLDIGYYLNNYSDVRISGRDPIIHYILYGYKENRNPNPKFNGEYYLKTYPDVKKSHLNPLVHYSIFGLKENRKTDKPVSHIKSEKMKVKHSDSGLKSENQVKNKYISNLFSNAFQNSQDYVDNMEDLSVQIQEDDVKLIAFYLPQFHPFQENDKWWGKGFTEWDNVTKAIPMFLGHYQPHLPVDLGFYDLRLIETQKRQIELAKKYGVFGFCYYYYWFNGKKLMETPLDNFINNPEELDIPFCLCWANENWTRRWDGNDDDILISQDYSYEEDLEFIKDLKKYITDPRYIKVDKKPLILVYKPQLIPHPKKTFDVWREYCRKNGIGELYILGAKRQDFKLEAEDYGLDGAYEFPPNYPFPNIVKENVKFLNPDYEPTVYDLEKFIEDEHYITKEENYEKFKTVMPYWDNTPRRLKDGQVYIGNPNVYKKWLKQAMDHTKSKLDKNKQFIFINAWNEWAEGAHLEPDKKYGYAYLKATAESILETRDNVPLSLNSPKK